MHIVKVTSARKLAADIHRAHAAVDQALIEITRLTTDMLEIACESHIAAAEGQKALEAVTEGISTFVAGRSRIVRAHRQMAGIKGRSNLEVIDMGCLPGPLTTGNLAAVG